MAPDLVTALEASQGVDLYIAQDGAGMIHSSDPDLEDLAYQFL